MLKRILVEAAFELILIDAEKQGKWKAMSRKDFLHNLVEAHSNKMISDKSAFELTKRAMSINA